MITALWVRVFNSSRSILREMRRRDAESQYEQNGAQDDLMFLHDGFSFRWERANALLAHRLAYVSTHCLINALPEQVPGSLARPRWWCGLSRCAAGATNRTLGMH